MADMDGKRQFTLRYLLVEVGLLAAAMGFTRVFYQGVYVNSTPTMFTGFVVMGAVIAASTLWGAAIGGVLGKPLDGALWGILAFPLFCALMPAAMRV